MVDLNGISILNLIPPNLASDKGVIMAATAFDKALAEIILNIPNVSVIPNISSITNNLLLDLLAWQFHVDFYSEEMPIELKRTLVLNSLDWHTRKGTPSAVEEVVTAVWNDAVVTEWYQYGGEPGYFRVTIDMPNTAESEADSVIRAIFSVKNTRSWLDMIAVLTQAHMRYHVGIGVYIDDTLDIGYPYVSKPETEAEIFTGAYPFISGTFDIFANPWVAVKAQSCGAYAGFYISGSETEIEIFAKE